MTDEMARSRSRDFHLTLSTSGDKSDDINYTSIIRTIHPFPKLVLECCLFELLFS